MNVMIVGVGGQGTLLASRIIGNAALAAGFEVKISEVHGMAQRGGSVVTYVRFSSEVHEPIVEEGGAEVLIAFEKLEALRYAHYLKKDGVLVVNDCKIAPITVTVGMADYPENILEILRNGHTMSAINAEKVAMGLGNIKVFNLVVLGLAAKFLGIEKQIWIDAIAKTVPPKTVQLNTNAFLRGYESA